ncbi:MAG: hypothetical protein ACMXYE_00025 [Candidatus Woesearchaeota archaeon]
MSSEKKGKEKLVIIDTNLHVQDPHGIILSYFNTQGDNQFTHGNTKSFLRRCMGLFGTLVFLKFFFQEMITTFWMALLIVLMGAVMGVIFVKGGDFFIRILTRSGSSDGLRGVFIQLTFMTLIVLVLGVFI